MISSTRVEFFNSRVTRTRILLSFFNTGRVYAFFILSFFLSSFLGTARWSSFLQKASYRRIETLQTRRGGKKREKKNPSRHVQFILGACDASYIRIHPKTQRNGLSCSELIIAKYNLNKKKNLTPVGRLDPSGGIARTMSPRARAAKGRVPRELYISGLRIS